MTYDRSDAIQHLTQCDRSLARLIEKIGQPELAPQRGTVFQALLKSIVYQQLSGKAAATIHRRLLEAIPRSSAQQARAIKKMSDHTLRAVGLSAAKQRAIRDLATREVGGQLPGRRQVARFTDDEVIERLTEVKGVGVWTAQMLLIFWLDRPDVLPATDLGLQNGFKVAYKKRTDPSSEAILKHGERWRPFRSLASWYLWRAADLAKQDGAKKSRRQK